VELVRRIARRSIIPLALVAMLLASVVVPPQASGAGYGRAGVVVQHLDGTIHKDCVTLPKPRISGFKLLRLSKFSYLTASFSFGKQVCWLDREGCKTTDPDRCTDCNPADGNFDGEFWAYFIQDRGDAGPQFASVGASDRTVKKKSIDYWSFGDGSTLPPAVSFKKICR
jgi:hypothetical protein